MRDNELIDERYRVIGVLGEGGFSTVYQAEDIITRKMLAVKVIKDEVLKNELTLARFEREARACASLNHSNIVRVINVGTHEGRPYMASELVKGKSLKDELDIRGKFSFREAADLMYQLCEAVAFAHAHLVVHRDIKPNNVYLTPDGTVKLGDFGIAYFENSRRVTKSEVIVGSVHYMAPEVSQGKTPTFQSDIYSIGITFFELITGKVPYDGANPIAVAMMHIKERFPNPRKVLPTVPKELDKIIMKACRKNPIDRYRSVTEMQKDLKAVLDNPKLLKPRQSFLARFFGFKMDE